MFRIQYKSVFVKNILCEKLEDVYYDWKRGFTGPEIYNLQLFNYKGHMSDDYIKANYKGICFEQADVIHSEQKNHGNHHFKGRVMVINNPFVNMNDIWVYTRKFPSSIRYAAKTQKYIIVQDSEFAEIFDIYATCEIDVNRIFTPEIKQRLLLLAGKYESFGLCFKGQRLNLAVESRRNAFDLEDYSKNIICDVEAERIRQDVADIVEVIEILGKQQNRNS